MFRECELYACACVCGGKGVDRIECMCGAIGSNIENVSLILFFTL